MSRTIDEFVDNIFFEDEQMIIAFEAGIYDVVLEGANLDARAAFKSCMKKHKVLLSRLKKEIKGENYKQAVITINDAEKNIDDCIDIIKKIDLESPVASTVLGFMVGDLPTFGRSLALSLIPGVGGAIANIVNFIEDIQGICRKIEEKDIKNLSDLSKLSINDFNIYQNKLITKLKYGKQALAKYKRLIPKLNEISEANNEN